MQTKEANSNLVISDRQKKNDLYKTYLKNTAQILLQYITIMVFIFSVSIQSDCSNYKI